jgi:hypothetical protein
VQPKAAASLAFLQRKSEGAFFGGPQQQQASSLPGSFAHEPTQQTFFPAIQAKLSISQPGDAHEKEADTMAERVMTMPEPASVPVRETEKEVQKKEEQDQHEALPVTEAPGKLQCKSEREEEKKIQPKITDGIWRKEEQAAGEDKGPDIPSLPALLTIDRKAHSRPFTTTIQRQGRAPPTPQPSFEGSLQSSKGSGSALPDSTRNFMETRFGADFSGVRIHTGSTAVQMSRDIHAQAFTHGNDVYFNNGKYAPHTPEGGMLLAHELTHTIQQGASRSLSPTAIATKRQTIYRQAADASPPRISNLDAAVNIAKGETGKVDAGTSGPDGLRTGWDRLIEYFQTAMGTDKVLPEGAPWQQGTISEGNIKHRGKIDGMKPNQPDPMVKESRDIMPSWCGIFVFWALNKAGLPMPKWRLGQSPLNLASAYPPGYAPRPGDIAYRTKFSHFAMVEKTEGTDVHTVNGNTAGENNLGGQVQVKKHAIKEWTGFFDPLYGIDPSQVSAPAAAVLPQTLREMQQLLFTSVQRKEEQVEEVSSAGDNEAQTAVQPKPEISSWQVNAAGSLQATPPAIQTKEEQRTGQETEAGEKEEQGPCSLMPIHAIDRMEDGGGDEVIQCSLIDNALTHISEFLSDIPITLDINVAKRWMLGKARQFAGYIPGYRALTVVLGYDPITGAEVLQDGRNFIEAALDIIPGGNLLKQKLDELGAIETAAGWIDTQIAAVSEIVQGVQQQFTDAWTAINIDAILDGPTAILRNIGGILERAINSVISFAERAATQLLTIVKEFLLNQLVTFVREQTTAYPLLRVVLGHDPVTEEEVPRNGANILNAMLELSEEGQEQRRQMQDTGTFDKVASWIDTGIGVFRDTYTQILNAFHNIWNRVSIQSLMDPVGTFQMIYNEFAGPVGRVLQYMADTVIMILRFIKEVLMRRLAAWARTVRGYPLVTVILERDPFTNERVPRTVENVIRGFMSLMEGGEEQFNQLQESGAIQRTVARINAAVARLNMTPAYIISLFTELWESFSIRDLANPVAAFRRIMDRFGAPIGRLVAFVVEIVKIVVEVVLQVMNFPTDLIGNIISKAMQAFDMIKRDPVGFLKNLLRAIKQGFIQFFQNILTHLMSGLTGWLMAELRDANVPAPTDFSLRGIIGWVLQVLGISMENIWQKLAAHPRIGPERVARIRSMINTLEGIWTFIKDVQERGMAAIWERIQEQLANLWDTVLNAIKSWIMDRIVNAVVTRLLSMLDPTGIMAVINSAIALYRAVQSFIRYLRQMLEIVNSFVEGVVEIASGNITRAANFLERTLGRAMPIVIGFLANQVGLSGIGRRIGEMITAARQMVDRALTWLVNRAVDTAFNVIDRLMALGRSAVAAVRGWIGRVLGLEKPFQAADGSNHRLYFVQRGSVAVLMINPAPAGPFEAWVREINPDTSTAAGALRAQKKTEAIAKSQEIDRENTQDVTGATDQARQAAEEAKATRMRTLLDQLSVLTGPLFTGERPNCATEGNGLVFGGTYSGKYGSNMMATFLTNNRMAAGSVPSVSHHQSYAVINQRRNAGGSYYVLGHLLNHNLSGTGRDWRNLTPLTREANSAHERIAESRVKTAVDAGNIVYYKVEAVYGRSAPTATDPAIQEIMNEEVHVPLRLICEAQLVTPAAAGASGTETRTSLVPAGTVIDNNVTQSETSYDLTGIRRPTVYLNTGNTTAIAGIDGVGASLAAKIVRAWTEKTQNGGARFASFEALSAHRFLDNSMFSGGEQSTITGLRRVTYVSLFQT